MFNSSYEYISKNEVLSVLLRNRGVLGDDDIDKFLKPNYERDLHDPYLYKDMDVAVNRIAEAVKKNEQIIVYGDYDCDGIPGSVVLHDFFTKIGYEHFEVYIPHRHKEGYGLNREAIERFALNGVSLLITVDSGITDCAEVARANELDIDVIITDHHLPGATLPPAIAVLNAKRIDNTYPDPWLCGAGVAFKLVQALIRHPDFSVPKGWEKWLMDVVGIATIADMVPLRGENRALAHFGLRALRQTRRPGILTLLRKLRIHPNTIAEDTIGFDIGPRINVASRLDVPLRAFELLSTIDYEQAGSLVGYLEELNENRKRMVRTALVDAEKFSNTDDAVIVVGSLAWPVGIVGLVAGRLVERFDKPVFAWGGGGEGCVVRGSCRSDGRVSIVELMETVAPSIFEGYGGHEAAGGFSIEEKNIEGLGEELSRAYARISKNDKKSNQAFCVDGELSLDDVDDALVGIIDQCAPYGQENPRPYFLFKNVPIVEASQFGKAVTHLKIKTRSAGKPIECVKFFEDTIPVGPTVTFIGTPERSFFAGRNVIRIRIHSLAS